jgi:2'-5' RNA ligase
MTRLFVAVGLPNSVVAAAAETSSSLRACLPAGISVRWVTPANMHLTVRFLGNVDDGRVPAIVEALRPPLGVAPFDVELDRCGVFPRSGAPRVIWIGLSDGVASLRAMHEQLNDRLEPLGLPPEARDFSVHLTLARIKDAPSGSSRDARACVASVQPPRIRWRVTTATTFQSLLSPKGATYQRLIEIPCQL